MRSCPPSSFLAALPLLAFLAPFPRLFNFRLVSSAVEEKALSLSSWAVVGLPAEEVASEFADDEVAANEMRARAAESRIRMVREST